MLYKKLKDIMIEKEITIPQLSEKTGLHEKYIEAIIEGDRYPNSKTYNLIVKALRVQRRKIGECITPNSIGWNFVSSTPVPEEYYDIPLVVATDLSENGVVNYARYNKKKGWYNKLFISDIVKDVGCSVIDYQYWMKEN